MARILILTGAILLGFEAQACEAHEHDTQAAVPDASEMPLSVLDARG